jgi:hypothetical protein
MMNFYSVGGAHGLNLAAPIFGVGFIGFSNGISATITLGYAYVAFLTLPLFAHGAYSLDAYRELGPEVMIAVSSLCMRIGIQA